MKSTIVFFFLFVVYAFSQDNLSRHEEENVIFSDYRNILDNPFDDVSDAIKLTRPFVREKWFSEQRMYPYNFIPSFAYQNALRQKNEIIVNFDNSSPAPWVNKGPAPVVGAHSQISSGRVVAVKYDPVNPNIIYLGTANGGLWKSTDGGASFSPLTDFEINVSFGALAIDPTNTNIIYWGTGASIDGYSRRGIGILKSTNGGLNWVNYTSGLPQQTAFSRLVIRPNNPSQLFAACGVVGGLFKSLDAGVTWNQVFAGRCDDIVFSPDGNNAYIIGSGTGFRRSTDGGNTFIEESLFEMGDRNQIAVSVTSPNYVYALTNSGNNGTQTKFYKSTNSGASFSRINDRSSSFGWAFLHLYVSRVNPNTIYWGNLYLWKSTDGGEIFKRNDITGSSYSFHGDQHNMDFNPLNPAEIIACNDGGVWKSTNEGGNWTNLNQTLSISQGYRVTSNPSNPAHIVVGLQDQGVYYTTGSSTWPFYFGGDGGEIAFSPANPQHIMAMQMVGIPWYSSDGGTGWRQIGDGLTGSASWLEPVAAHPTQAGVFYTGRNKIFVSSNGGRWTEVSSNGLNGGVIEHIAVSKSNPSVIYATTGAKIFRSSDGASSFSDVSAGLPDRIITSVHVHPDSQNVALISFSGFGTGKIYKTTNGSASWMDISGNLPDSPANDVLIYYPGSPTSTYAAATDIGVFITTNYGSSWSVLGSGLPNAVAMSLDHNPALTNIRVSTFGRGVWETTPTPDMFSPPSLPNEIPSSYVLYQNYPNPFNPSTVIRYRIVEPGMVKIAVYDALGRLCSEPVSEYRQPGTYEYIFDARSLSSGVYFYKLTAGNYSDTKKMQLVK